MGQHAFARRSQGIPRQNQAARDAAGGCRGCCGEASAEWQRSATIHSAGTGAVFEFERVAQLDAGIAERACGEEFENCAELKLRTPGSRCGWIPFSKVHVGRPLNQGLKLDGLGTPDSP